TPELAIVAYTQYDWISAAIKAKKADSLDATCAFVQSAYLVWKGFMVRIQQDDVIVDMRRKFKSWMKEHVELKFRIPTVHENAAMAAQEDRRILSRKLMLWDDSIYLANIVKAAKPFLPLAGLGGSVHADDPAAVAAGLARVERTQLLDEAFKKLLTPMRKIPGAMVSPDEKKLFTPRVADALQHLYEVCASENERMAFRMNDHTTPFDVVAHGPYNRFPLAVGSQDAVGYTTRLVEIGVQAEVIDAARLVEIGVQAEVIDAARLVEIGVQAEVIDGARSATQPSATTQPISSVRAQAQDVGDVEMREADQPQDQPLVPSRAPSPQPAHSPPPHRELSPLSPLTQELVDPMDVDPSLHEERAEDPPPTTSGDEISDGHQQGGPSGEYIRSNSMKVTPHVHQATQGTKRRRDNNTSGMSPEHKVAATTANRTSPTPPPQAGPSRLREPGPPSRGKAKALPPIRKQPPRTKGIAPAEGRTEYPPSL
ncbi:hypothetical protein EUX98_g8783, partial [Antrodiella citrinella]